ncbi:MAG: DsbA family protein [Deltaproteobacteria bacterium]|nr:DsbA family protein [Deltaproteobacteria bacterium]
MSDGPADAPVTIVEFSDYECPVCRKTHVLTKEIKEMYKGKIRWVFKDFPLRQHQWASLAAEAARCAGEQGKFWEYQDRLYSSDKELTVEQLSFIAKDLGMKPEPFAACLSNGKYRNEVEKDRQEGKVNGVSTTPTYVINGKFVPGAPTLEQFKEMIEAELAKTKPKS